MTKRGTLLAVLCAALAAGCSDGGLSDGDIDALNAEQRKLNTTLSDLNTTLGSAATKEPEELAKDLDALAGRIKGSRGVYAGVSPDAELEDERQGVLQALDREQRALGALARAVRAQDKDEITGTEEAVRTEGNAIPARINAFAEAVNDARNVD